MYDYGCGGRTKDELYDIAEVKEILPLAPPKMTASWNTTELAPNSGVLVASDAACEYVDPFKAYKESRAYKVR